MNPDAFHVVLAILAVALVVAGIAACITFVFLARRDLS